MKYILIALLIMLPLSFATAQDKFPSKSAWTITDGGAGGTLDKMPKLADVCRILLLAEPKPNNGMTNKQWCQRVLRKEILNMVYNKTVLYDIDRSAEINIKNELDF